MIRDESQLIALIILWSYLTPITNLMPHERSIDKSMK
jgi:hypothetical protein